MVKAHVPNRHRQRYQEIIVSACCNLSALNKICSRFEGVDIIWDSELGTYIINAPNRFSRRIQAILKKNGAA